MVTQEDYGALYNLADEMLRQHNALPPRSHEERVRRFRYQLHKHPVPSEELLERLHARSAATEGAMNLFLAGACLREIELCEAALRSLQVIWGDREEEDERRSRRKPAHAYLSNRPDSRFFLRG